MIYGLYNYNDGCILHITLVHIPLCAGWWWKYCSTFWALNICVGPNCHEAYR